MTGPACDIPCNDGSTCDYELICHSWGATYGITVYGAYLFPCSSNWPEWAVKQLPPLFITEHENSLGLESDLTLIDLDLAPGPMFRASAGKLTYYRFTQSYRGFPVFGPDRLVTLVMNYKGAVAMRGAILDARVPFRHADNQASKTLAEASALTHTANFTGIPIEELAVANSFLAAVPRDKAIGWVTTVVRGLGKVATVVVEADPLEPALLPVLNISRNEAEGLADTVQITVRAEDLESDITMGEPATGVNIETADVDELFDMTPLLGSTEIDQFRLGNERVVAYDASMVTTTEELDDLPVISAAVPSFLASPGTTLFRAQSNFSFVNNAFRRTDMLMAGKWESTNPLEDLQPVIPPAEFFPRAMIFTDTPDFFGDDSIMCPDVPACVGDLPVGLFTPSQVEVEYQQPLDGPLLEGLAGMYLRPDNKISLVGHEFGHVVDYFTHPGVMGMNTGCMKGEICMPSCVENTTDEGPPLQETFGSLISIWLGHEFIAIGQDPTDCTWVPDVSLGPNSRPHNELCRPNNAPFPRLIRDDDPSCTDGIVCDKPFRPGFLLDKETMTMVPTGACADGGANGGYSTDSMFQTLWELLNEQTCSESPPFTCQPLTELQDAGDSGDIQGGTLLFAAAVNSMTYRGFAGDMAIFIACNFGDAAYFDFNQVACHHGLRPCDAGVPISCEICGDSVREGAEECDGPDLGGSTCESLDMGFDGGILLCDPESCTFDTSMCTASESSGGESTASASEGGVPTGGPTSGATLTSGNTEDSSMAESSTTEGPVDDGCDCQQSTNTVNWAAWLLVAGILGRRRSRRAVSSSALASVLMLAGAGCSLKDNASIAMASADASSEPTSTTADDGESSSSGTMAPTSLFGVFHYEKYTDGFVWEDSPDDNTLRSISWINVVIEPDSSLHVEYYSCGVLSEIQNFIWEQDGEGLRIVPPNGDGEPYTFFLHEVLEVSIKPGEACGEVLVQVHRFGSEEPYQPETYVPGQLCTTNVSSNSCGFEFKWCEGHPAPPVCE